MVVQGTTFKIFIGNVSEQTTGEDLRGLFSQYGTVLEADVKTNYGFVHMSTAEERKVAIENLNNFELHDRKIVVEASKSRTNAPANKTKIFIGNIHKDTTIEELRSLFVDFGEVVETDILNNFGFVHMSDERCAQDAIHHLDGTDMHGQSLRVKESNSKVRQNAGMGSSDACYRCGSTGHWSKECPTDRGGRDRGRERTRGRDRGGYGRERGGGGGYGRERGGGGDRSRSRSMHRRDDYDRGRASDWGPRELPPPPSYYERRDRYGGYPPPPPIYPEERYRPSDRFYEDYAPPSDGRFHQMREYPYERRRMDPLPPPPPAGDYLRYSSRRSPPPRYQGLAPPAPISSGASYKNSLPPPPPRY